MATLYEQIRQLINRDKHSTHQQKRTARQVAALQANVLEATAAAVEHNSLGGGNYLISGSAVWDTGLTFRVTQCVYVIEGETYTSLPNSVTLDAADATNPRIDVIAIGTDGIPVVVTGTAAADPVRPEVSSEQVMITFATVAALATTPTGVSDIVIYDEDDDWTTAVSGTRVAKADTSDPLAGTKHISFTNTSTGDYITLDRGSVTSAGGISSFKMYLKNLNYNSRASRKNLLRVALFNGTTRVSEWAHIINGRYGFEWSNTGYQLITIPTSILAPTGDFDILKIEAIGSVTHHIDNISHQGGITEPSVSNYALLDQINLFTKAQTSRIVQLTDGATITVDLSLANVFEVTLDGNRTIDFTNATPGQHFTLKVQQDDTTGGRTLTWDAANDWAGGTAPTLATGTDAVDILTFFVDSAGNIHGSLGVADSQ